MARSFRWIRKATRSSCVRDDDIVQIAVLVVGIGSEGDIPLRDPDAAHPRRPEEFTREGEGLAADKTGNDDGIDRVEEYVEERQSGRSCEIDIRKDGAEA